MQFPYKIDAQIFTQFPDYQRGIVFGFDLENGESPVELIADLRLAGEELRNRIEITSILENPHIAAWREAYRQAGFKPSEFRPSVEGLVRRVLRGDALPSISRIVDIGTLLSIQHLVPIGAHAIDKLEHGLILRPANGNERFEPFGSQVPEHPNPGEIIFCDGDTVVTRRWTWRQANHTLIEADTRAVEFNIDALPVVTTLEIQKICSETVTLLEKYCHANCRIELLNQANPEISFNSL